MLSVSIGSCEWPIVLTSCVVLFLGVCDRLTLQTVLTIRLMLGYMLSVRNVDLAIFVVLVTVCVLCVVTDGDWLDLIAVAYMLRFVCPVTVVSISLLLLPPLGLM